ncbi:hypothetical protein NKH52_02480 [Mesorhizobium sp. M1066]|uniref:Uncharacterized protein n=1 Tax=Mesorhizobium opportunistum TaxID=593909 RepID=A0ABV1YJU3_9HYPH
MSNTVSSRSTDNADLDRLEGEARLAEARAKLLTAEHVTQDGNKKTWWKDGQLNLLIIGGIVTIMGNLGVAAYNGYETRSEDRLKAVNDLDLQRETAKSDLLLSAMRINDSKAAQQNNLFFIDSGLIADPGDKLKKAVTKYFPVLPAPSGAVPSFLTLLTTRKPSGRFP